MARIVIDPVTRIEGHLRIEVEMNDHKVTDAWSSGKLGDPEWDGQLDVSFKEILAARIGGHKMASKKRCPQFSRGHHIGQRPQSPGHRALLAESIDSPRGRFAAVLEQLLILWKSRSRFAGILDQRAAELWLHVSVGG
jgi:hypothetical protein